MYKNKKVIKSILFNLIICTLLIFTYSCTLTNNQSSRSKLKASDITIIRDFRIEKEPDYSIGNVLVSDSILVIFLNYKGGKRTYTFDLIFNGKYLKSLPVQVNLFLKPNKVKKSRDKIQKRQLKFKLTKLEHLDYGTLIINLYSFPEKIHYKYSVRK